MAAITPCRQHSKLFRILYVNASAFFPQGELPDVECPVEEEEEAPEEGEKVELFYTEGSPELHEERKMIARLSLPRAAARIAAQKRRREDPDEDEDAELDEVVKTMTRTAMQLRYENCNASGFSLRLFWSDTLSVVFICLRALSLLESLRDSICGSRLELELDTREMMIFTRWLISCEGLPCKLVYRLSDSLACPGCLLMHFPRSGVLSHEWAPDRLTLRSCALR